MIPIRTEVTNLGAIPHAVIDFSSLNLAVVVGPNGTGKSTLITIAPLFALFGGTKNGCSIDDMVRSGQQEMAVIFDFEHRGEVYRVSRTRSKKGRGKSSCELQHMIEDHWVSESGTTLRETDEKIRALLNLDEETFTASSMILQGKANEFTAKPAGQRKAILQQILGLEIYERLQEQARAKERVVSVELEVTKRKLDELDEKLKGRTGLKQQQSVVNDELLGLTLEINLKEAELKEARETVSALEAMIRKAEELQGQIDSLAGEITKIQGEKQEQQSRLDRANNILATEAKIIEKTAEHERIKEEVVTLKAKVPRLKELEDEDTRLIKEAFKVETALSRLGVQIRGIEVVLGNRAEIEKAATEYHEAVKSLENMDRLADTWNKLNIKSLEADRRVSDWDKLNKYTTDNLKARLDDLKKQSATLEKVPCADEMAEQCLLLTAANKARADIPRIEEGIRKADEVQNPHIKEWEALIKERDALGYGAAEHKKLKALAIELRSKAEQAAQLEGKVELLENLNQQQIQRREEVRNLQQEIRAKKNASRALAEELRPLPTKEARLPKLAEWVKAKEELPAARQLVTNATDVIEKLVAEIAAKEKQVKELELECFALSKETSKLGITKALVANSSGDIKSLQTKQNCFHVKAGGIKAQLEALAKDEEERQRLADELQPKAKELTRWQTLVKAFGRDGIPALIIENAIPELERISNEFLGQMSNGRHSLRFETQRELKSSKGAKTETLDIIVGDWAGDRPYETFSGGEQLRIDFAIRFALAELLARRAGSKIEWLVVDEGLGSQDREHRALVLESIRAVADRFRKTLIITHIEEAQATFDQVIYLEPREDGVDVKIS